MGVLSVTNNTSIPINVATSWAGIVQEFRNKIPPRKKVNLKGIETGWHDLAVKAWVPGDEFNHDQDWVGALAITTTTLGVLFTPVTGGLSAVMVAGILVTIGGVAASVASYAFSPAQLRGVPARLKPITINVTGWQPTLNQSKPPEITGYSDMLMSYSIPGQGFEKALSGGVRSGQRPKAL